MAVALEPSETKCPGSSTPMVHAGMTEEEGQPMDHLNEPLPEPSAIPWAPSGWAW